MEQHFLRATSLPRLHIAAPTLREMQVVMIAQMPKHQFGMTMDVKRSMFQILNDPLAQQIH
jgi:hypothetical protein